MKFEVLGSKFRVSSSENLELLTSNRRPSRFSRDSRANNELGFTSFYRRQRSENMIPAVDVNHFSGNSTPQRTDQK